MRAWKRSRVSSPEPLPAAVRSFIREAVDEDLGSGDITTRVVIPPKSTSRAVIIAKQTFILAGMRFAEEVFRCVDWRVLVEPLVEEGAKIKKGTELAAVSGKTTSLLAGERTALNILQRLSGIATLTAKFVQQTEATRAKILDTRKTTPGMRYLEKYAVRIGGGENHRMGLYDGVLIKDNHIEAAGGITHAVRMARKAHLRDIEVECETLEQVCEALEAGADIIMLDNMSISNMRRAVRFAEGKALVEASGGVTLSNVRRIAETGVDFISIGALTHSAHSVDISLKFE